MNKNTFYKKNCDSWLKNELINICISLNLKTSGNKNNICKRIKEYYTDIQNDINNFLKQSAKKGDLKRIKFLIEEGADVRANNSTALMTSVENGHLEIVKYLVEQGSDIHAGNDEVMVLSILANNFDIVKYLVEQGANIHVDNDFPLISSSIDGKFDMVKYLVEQGANIHADNDFPLISTSRTGNFDIVKYLVEQGADIHANNDEALRGSAENGHLEIVKYLIENSNFSLTILKEILNNSTKEVNNFITRIINKDITFKKTTNVLIDLVKNKNNFFKWQTICANLKDKNTTELINLATLQGIQTNNKSKRHICKDLAVAYETQMLTTPECHNETSILGDSIELIPKPLLITFKDNGKQYCFNIIELMEMINKGDYQNPYTRNKLPIDEIKDKMLILRKILIEDKLSLVNILDEIKNNQIMTKENILRLQIVNLFALLNYTPSIEKIINIDQLNIDKMFDFLNENSLLQIRGDHTVENLISESLRLLQIDDSDKMTRKAAYEVYLNEVFNN